MAFENALVWDYLWKIVVNESHGMKSPVIRGLTPTQCNKWVSTMDSLLNKLSMTQGDSSSRTDTVVSFTGDTV